MINTRKFVTKMCATVTCVAMIAGNGIAGYAAESVAIDTSTAVSNSYLSAYTQETERWYAMWKDTSSIQINPLALPPTYSQKADITEESEVTVDGKKATFIKKDSNDEGVYYIFGLIDSSSTSTPSDTSTEIAKTTETPKETAPVTSEQKYYNNIAEKDNEILLADKGKSISGTKHVEYREGNALSSDMMETLSKTSGVTLDYYFTYNGKHYYAAITSEAAKKAFDGKTEWYGPECMKKFFDVKALD